MQLILRRIVLHLSMFMSELVISLKRVANGRNTILYVVFAAAFIFASCSAMASLVKVWLGRDDYSHGFLVPVISLAIAWSKRDLLRAMQPNPSILAGVVVVLMSGIALWI